jgi:hypothetical protein
MINGYTKKNGNHYETLISTQVIHEIKLHKNRFCNCNITPKQHQRFKRIGITLVLYLLGTTNQELKNLNKLIRIHSDDLARISI